MASLRTPFRRSASEPTYNLGFCLFLLVNAVLFIRPAEIVPDLVGLPIYEVVILVCLAVNLPAWAGQLAPASLQNQPISVCVLALLPAVMLSFLLQGSLWGMRVEGFDFLKVVLYYLLLISTVNSSSRLRHFLYWLGGFILILTILALANYYNWFDNPALVQLMEKYVDKETGQLIIVPRLCSTGLYNNPNALARILLVGAFISLYGLLERHAAILRILSFFSLLIFVFGIYLTHSRGGLLGFLAGTFVFLFARFGWRKSIPLALVVFPILLAVNAGRQTEIGDALESGTGQNRIQLWSMGFALFRQQPLTGIGMYQYEELVENGSHNAFVQSYVELGILGGTFFVGAFYLALSSLFQLRNWKPAIKDAECRTLHPYLLSAVAAYFVGMFSIGIAYILPTYLLLGLVTVYLRAVSANSRVPVPRMTPRLMARLCAVSAVALASFYVYIRLFVNWNVYS